MKTAVDMKDFMMISFLVHPEVIVMSTNPWITIWRHRHYHAEEHD